MQPESPSAAWLRTHGPLLDDLLTMNLRAHVSAALAARFRPPALWDEQQRYVHRSLEVSLGFLSLHADCDATGSDDDRNAAFAEHCLRAVHTLPMPFNATTARVAAVGEALQSLVR